ncbi:aldose 1-epimerase [Alsobacter metallidurans]|uniref:aldose 1-epimerase n=1 Tax=Alsobacter metallidurans TaxID=340221 RepID=UPI00166B2773|nr:aldose 1-epimerase [Alsobacter metallidurans]
MLAAGALRAALAPGQGGRVAGFWRETDGQADPILMPMAEAAFDPLFWPKAGCYPLAPFSNRIRDGRFRFGGRDVQLPAHPACPPHALHGFSQLRAWSCALENASAAVMTYAHEPDAWPWRFTATQTVRLSETALAIAIAIRNEDATPIPVGLGLHPYLVARHGDRVRFNAGIEWSQDEAGCGIAPQRLSGSEAAHDLRHGAAGMTRYFADWDGRVLIDRADGRRISIKSDGVLDQLVMHAPEGGAYLCVEPVSHVADAFNLAARGVQGAGTRVAGPGETVRGSMTIALE